MVYASYYPRIFDLTTTALEANLETAEKSKSEMTTKEAKWLVSF